MKTATKTAGAAVEFATDCACCGRAVGAGKRDCKGGAECRRYAAQAAQFNAADPAKPEWF